MKLASIMPTDLTSAWRCGRQSHKTNAANLSVCQEDSCPITQARLPEVAAALWTVSLQACQNFQFVEAEAVPSDSPSADLLYHIVNTCGVHKVGPLSSGSDAMACSECDESGQLNSVSANNAVNPGSNDLDMGVDDYEATILY